MKMSDDVRIADHFLCSVVDNEELERRLNSIDSRLCDSIIKILCSHTDLRAHISENLNKLEQEVAELREALQVSFDANDAFLSNGEMMDYDDFERIKKLLNK